jgi:hypothetical protein
MPLAIRRCRTHGIYFTVYPPGYTPYARQRLRPVSERASPVDDAARWKGTVFEAAAQASAGEAGLRDAGFDAPSSPRHATQRRRIERAARLLGLSDELDERRAETVAHALDLPGLDHRQERTRFGQATTLRERGNVILAVLSRLTPAPVLERRLLCAGLLAELWGPPVLWDARTSRRVFPACGTDPPKPSADTVPAANEIVPVLTRDRFSRVAPSSQQG